MANAFLLISLSMCLLIVILTERFKRDLFHASSIIWDGNRVSHRRVRRRRPIVLSGPPFLQFAFISASDVQGSYPGIRDTPTTGRPAQSSRALPGGHWTALVISLMIAILTLGIAGLRIRAANRWSMRRRAGNDNVVRLAEVRHDKFMQALLGLLLRLRTAANQVEAGPTRDLLEDVLAQAQGMMSDGESLTSLLQTDDQSEHVRVRLGVLRIASQYHIEEGEAFSLSVLGLPHRLRDRVWGEVLAICSECLSNATRHAAKTKVAICFTFRAGDFEMIVTDTGAGLPIEVLSGARLPGQWGIVGMKERAQRIGARLSFEQNQPRGTLVRLIVPASSAYEKEHSHRLLNFWSS